MTDQDKYYWNIDRIMKLLLGVVLAAGLLWLIYYLRDALLPFFVACVIAYILQPVVVFNQRWTHLKGRTIASILTVVQALIVVGLLCWLAIPSIVDNLKQLVVILHKVSDGSIDVPASYQPMVEFMRRYLNPDTLLQMVTDMNMDSLMHRSSALLQESAAVIMHTLAWLLTFIYILFILIDYPQIVRGFKLIVPQKYRPQALAVVRDIQQGMNHYFRGQGKVAVCAMVLYCIGFLIIGLPLAIPMGVLVGILYMIPYFQYITLIPVASICFVYSLGGQMEFWPEMGKVALVYVVSQCICDYLITPRVMGKELGLNPAVILLSLSVWGSLLGIIGIIIALPVTALVMSYYQKYISNRS